MLLNFLASPIAMFFAIPIFIYYLLVNVSGIPMLEKAADQKWGNNEDYISYKDRTNILFLKKPD